MTIYGLLNFSFWQYVVFTLVTTHITIVAVTVYLHRCQAHRALDLHPALSHLFRFWLWLATGTSTREWAAVHRKHHAKCETIDDPHSPQVLGIKTVLWQGYELYKTATANPETIARYGNGTPDDWLENRLYRPHSLLGIFSLLAVELVLLGIPALIIWAIQMMWIPFFAAGVINGIGHYFGYRNFEYPDASRNIFPLGILVGGEELHNNHHTYGTSAKLSIKWWEFDLGWAYICLFKYLGLAKIKRLPPKLLAAANKSSIDGETLKAVISNQFQVMARYSKEVIIPVLKEEKRKAGTASGNLLKRARALLTRTELLIDDSAQQHLNHMLDKFQTLKLVYHYRLRLQTIWSRSTASQKELLEALRDWCKQAEATGIEALQRFVANLKTYSLCPT